VFVNTKVVNKHDDCIGPKDDDGNCIHRSQPSSTGTNVGVINYANNNGQTFVDLAGIEDGRIDIEFIQNGNQRFVGTGFAELVDGQLVLTLNACAVDSTGVMYTELRSDIGWNNNGSEGQIVTKTFDYNGEQYLIIDLSAGYRWYL